MRLRNRFQRLVLTAVVGLVVAAPAQAKSLRVVASFTVLADMVRNVGGDRIELHTLVGPDGDPHTYEPSPADARVVRNADLVFVNGLGLEGWMERFIKAAGYKGQPVVTTRGIHFLTMDDDGKTVLDPHAWNDAANGISYVRDIAKALAAADPADAASFEKNAKTYEASLAQVDADTKAAMAGLAPERRKILTTHDALGYFAKAYGVSIVSPLGVSTDEEPSAAVVAALIRQIKAEHIKTYFLENSNDPRLIQQIARATGAKPGGELFVESLSKADGPAATYVSMLRHNFNLIVKAMRDQV